MRRLLRLYPCGFHNRSPTLDFGIHKCRELGWAHWPRLNSQLTHTVLHALMIDCGSNFYAKFFDHKGWCSFWNNDTPPLFEYESLNARFRECWTIF